MTDREKIHELAALNSDLTDLYNKHMDSWAARVKALEEELKAYKQCAAHDSKIIHEQEAEIEQLKAEIAKARKIIESLVWDMRTTAGTSEPFTSDEEEDLYAADQWLKKRMRGEDNE